MPRRKKKVQENFPYETSAILDMNDIYAVINFVQLSRKECSFVADTEDSVVMEHLFQDCNISYEKFPETKGIKFSLMPPPVEDVPEEAFIIKDDYDDEIIEDGQCF